MLPSLITVSNLEFQSLTISLCVIKNTISYISLILSNNGFNLSRFSLATLPKISSKVMKLGIGSVDILPNTPRKAKLAAVFSKPLPDLSSLATPSLFNKN